MSFFFIYIYNFNRVFEHHGQVRLGMMRHLYVVVDGSRTMEDQDLKPSRLTCTLKVE
ncbi:General transcription factor IIH subunit 2 [Lemmus lemmus]